jgi:tRNA modification GTPase trmE
MSGKECFEILDKIFLPKKMENIENIKGYTMKYGHIVENLKEYDGFEVPESAIVDEVLVSYFKEPMSYTTENMCEINTHGGNIVVKKILELCLKNGAEMAEPGEFTKRAFLNGRIDLLQAESVIDIIDAKSERELKAGMNQLEGRVSKEIHDIKQKIMDVMVNVEVDIDYPEYDVEEVTNTEINEMLDVVIADLSRLEKSFDNGKILKDGVKTAIIGKPNAGKSSLLNCILNEERAIVTEIEGTTRDTIEEFVTVEGVPLKLIDTAGIREAKDEVEKIGITKSKEIAKDADLIIAIFDSSKDLTDEDKEILDIIKNKTAIVVLNKMDLINKIDENMAEIKNVSKYIVKMSTLEQKGIDDLYKSIGNLFSMEEISLDNTTVITNVRHKNLISKALNSCREAKKSMELGMPLDIIAIFLKEILENLGEITGETVTDDIIDEIFSKFCLGK